MKVCPKSEIKFINDIDGDYDRYVDAMITLEEEERLNSAIDRAKRSGYYSSPENRLSGYISTVEKLVGKIMTIEDIDGYSFEDVKVTSAVPVSDGIVEINGQYQVNLRESMLTNGNGHVSIGSENLGNRNTTSLGELTGTVLTELDTLISTAESLDGHVSDPRVTQVFKMYKDVLSEVGTDVELSVEVLKDLDNKNTAGYATPENGKITLINGNTRYNTHADILAHELQHVMVHKVLSSDNMVRAQVLKLRDILRAEVDYTVFLPRGTDKFTSEDIEFAKERYDYVFRNADEKVAADEFLVAATTNLGLMDKLDTVRDYSGMTLVSKVKVKPGEKSRWKKLWNRLADKINRIYSKVKSEGKSGRDLAVDMLHTVLELEHADKTRKAEGVYEKAIEKILQADQKIAEFTTRQKSEQKTFRENIREVESDKLDKAMTALWNVRGLAKVKSAIMQNNVFSSLTRDMGQPDVAKFYQMFRHAKVFVENAVAPMKQATIDVLNSTYRLGELDLTTRQAAKRVLIDTDAKVLGDASDILGYLEDESKIDAELEVFAGKYSAEVVNATNDLGMLLVSNESNVHNVHTNAAQIGHDFLDMQIGEEVDEVDRAATLVALKNSSKENKALALEALRSKPEGINHTLRLLAKNEKDLLEKAYSNDPMYLIKGAKQEAYTGDKRYYIVEEKEMKSLKRAKLAVIGKHEAISEVLGKDVYLVVGDSIDVSYTEGLLSKVQLRNEGESLRKLLTEMSNMSEEEVQNKIEAISESGHDDMAQSLIPERSGLGRIYDYRMRIPHEVKSKYLGVDDDIIRTVAETVSNLTHKQEAMTNNRASIHYFKKFYKKYKGTKDFKFIEISSESKGRFKEYWDSLPFYLKKDVDKLMDGKLMIEESFLTDFFGYKDVSIVNLPFLRNSKKRQMTARKVESIIQELTKAWKHSVVAKTLSTIVGNTSSNMVVALQHTQSKNPAKYIKDFTTIWSELNAYNDMKRKVSTMDIRRNAGEKLDEVEYRNLQASMKNSPIYPIMKDGQFSAILEDIDQEWFENKGIMEETLDKLLDKTNRKNGKVGIKDLVNQIYLRKGSLGHDSVMKLTSYADTINKVIIYNALKAEGKMKEQEILNYVDQLHVNYGYLDNRWIKYANDTLIFSFTKYFFRVFPAMIKMLNKKAASVFFTESVINVSGIGETPISQFYNPFESMARKVGGWSDPMNIFGMILSPIGTK